MPAKLFKVIAVISICALSCGCSFIFQTGRPSDVQKIQELSGKLDELSEVKKVLEDRLAQEIKDKEVKLMIMEKGLVITFVADILFDSGKAKLRPEALPKLDKVARVLNENAADLKVGIEGHTDSDPIKISGWKSNWELATERALSVLHYLTDRKKVQPARLSVIGHGEYQPVANNITREGKKLNRRVEVVIYPKLTKVKSAQETKGSQSQNIN